LARIGVEGHPPRGYAPRESRYIGRPAHPDLRVRPKCGARSPA
jgi:hypothetical protein